MYLPLAASSLTLAASLHGLLNNRPLPHAARDAVYGLAAATGMAGNGFHLWNIGKRPGGFSWLNLFYGAPLGAPVALCWPVRRPRRRAGPRECGGAPARMLGHAGRAGAGRADRRRPAGHQRRGGAVAFPRRLSMIRLWSPRSPCRRWRRRCWPARGGAGSGGGRWRLARCWLRLTALLGFAGVGFHAYGVSAEHGRLAQLEPERPRRTAPAGTAELSPASRWRVWRRSAARRSRRGMADASPFPRL